MLVCTQVIIPYRDEDEKRHLKVMGDLGQIVPLVRSDVLRPGLVPANDEIGMGHSQRTTDRGVFASLRHCLQPCWKGV